MNLAYGNKATRNETNLTSLKQFARAFVYGAVLLGCASAPAVTRFPVGTDLDVQSFLGTKIRKNTYHYRNIKIGDVIGTPDERIRVKILHVNWTENRVKFEVYWNGEKMSGDSRTVEFNQEMAFFSSLYGRSVVDISFTSYDGINARISIAHPIK